MAQLEPKHCDEYVGDKSQPKCLRMFLLYHRVPAIQRCRWDEKGCKIPVLFANLKSTPKGFYGGQRVRVTMASRFGDVGVSPDLDQTNGYEARLSVEDITNFSEEKEAR